MTGNSHAGTSRRGPQGLNPPNKESLPDSRQFGSLRRAKIVNRSKRRERRADGAIAVGCHRPNLALKNSFLRSLRFLLFHGGCGQRPRWGVEPPLLAMRSNGRCSPQRPDLRLRDARHQLAFDDFIWPLALRPAREGSLDEFRRLTRQIQHADDLLGGGPRGCPARRSRSRSISQTLANRPRQLSIASLFDGTQCLPSRGPPSPPQAHLMPFQPDSQHNLLVGESLDGE